MYQALQQGKNLDVQALWTVARSCPMSVVNAGEDQQAILAACLHASSDGYRYIESSFLHWSIQLSDLLDNALGTASRSLKKDLIWIQEHHKNMMFGGQFLTRSMLHACSVVVAVFHKGPMAEAAAASLVALGCQHGHLVHQNYTRMREIASAAKRWCLDKPAGQVAAYVCDLLHFELNREVRPVEFYKTGQLVLQACSECERIGHICSKGCKGKSWLRLALEKWRLHLWLVSQMRERGIVPEAESKFQGFVKLLETPLASLPQECSESLQPWLEILQGQHDSHWDVPRLRLQLLRKLPMYHGGESEGTALVEDGGNKEKSAEKAMLLEKATCYMKEKVKFIYPSVPTKEDDWEKAMAELGQAASRPGVLNEDHRIFVLCAELMFDPPKQPWSLSSDLGPTTRQTNIFKAALEWACKQASGSGDMILVSDGHCFKLKNIVEEQLRTGSRGGHIGVVRCFWSQLPRPGRRVFASESSDSWSAVLYCKSPRVRIAQVDKKAGLFNLDFIW